VVTAAKAQAESTRIAAEAQAEATILAAKADADAIRQRALADLEVTDGFAREMEMRRVEVSRVKAFGHKV
jgi:regulator of protease activity HflC (stomatin/prohibitin superfamily)